MTITLTRRRVLVLAALLALSVVAAALAAWLITADGDGRSKVATLTAPTVSVPASFTGAATLLPGGTAAVQVLITNPNAVALTITGYSNGAGNTFIPSNPATCPASNFSLVSGTAATPAVVPANAVNFAVSLGGAISLAAAAPTGCQGQDVTSSGGTFRVNFST